MAFAFLIAICAAAAVLGSTAALAADPEFDAAHWRRAFARPAEVPAPADNPTTPAKVDLGRLLFSDQRLSGSGALSCATCHDPLLSFQDGVALRTGLDGASLPRRTPSLWNLAWGLTFFWDGRAKSLEAQATGPITHAREMGAALPVVLGRLGADPDLTKRFAAAFPEDLQVSERTLTQALAAFERSLVSPETRFDRWVKGDDKALAADELAGLKLFTGKAGCVACHSGWRFTDEAFHDVGLPSADRGRGEALGLKAADHAFKTPSLRERAWTAPYMHDGSLPSLEAVVAHYVGGVVDRSTVSKDLKRPLPLTTEEQDQLVAFLATLSSEEPPRPVSLPPKVQSFGIDPSTAVSAREVRQKGRRFSPGAVSVALGEALTVLNDDDRTHNVRVDDPRVPALSEAQEPGDSVVLAFPELGQYQVICGIHPEMRLEVVVRRERAATAPAQTLAAGSKPRPAR